MPNATIGRTDNPKESFAVTAFEITTAIVAVAFMAMVESPVNFCETIRRKDRVADIVVGVGNVEVLLVLLFPPTGGGRTICEDQNNGTRPVVVVEVNTLQPHF